jgi:hypothetical protein
VPNEVALAAAERSDQNDTDSAQEGFEDVLGIAVVADDDVGVIRLFQVQFARLLCTAFLPEGSRPSPHAAGPHDTEASLPVLAHPAALH